MLDNLSLKQKKIILIIGIIVVIGVLYFIYNKDKKVDIEQYDENILVKNSNTVEETSEEKEQIIVHITGAVKTPGIVKLEEGSRIEDAINLAGGLTEDADISNVNLAYVLDDGVKIKIPSNLDIEATEEETVTKENGEDIIEDTNTSQTEKKEIININKATEEELQNLPGIGVELASRIIEYRKENGDFSNTEEIKNVSGIGDSKYEKIKDLICTK